MKRIAGFALLALYSGLLGAAAWHLAPKYIFWANAMCAGLPPLLLPAIGLFPMAVLASSLPLLLIARLLDWTGSVAAAAVSALVSGGPIAFTLYAYARDGKLGPDFAGWSWFVLAGCAFIAFPAVAILHDPDEIPPGPATRGRAR